MLFWIRIVLFVILTCSAKLSYGKIKREFQDPSILPECSHEDSVCGYVELNSMGVSTQSFCRCKDFISCPDTFDRYDGRTISHGTSQYKYCREAPRLKPCQKDEIVHNSHIEFDENFFISEADHRIHCICPRSHIFVRNTTVDHARPDASSYLKTQYTCSLPKICEPQQHCMAITQTPHTSFVTKLCNCPMDSFCPTDVRYAAKVLEFTKGPAYIMNCI